MRCSHFSCASTDTYNVQSNTGLVRTSSKASIINCRSSSVKANSCCILIYSWCTSITITSWNFGKSCTDTLEYPEGHKTDRLLTNSHRTTVTATLHGVFFTSLCGNRQIQNDVTIFQLGLFILLRLYARKDLHFSDWAADVTCCWHRRLKFIGGDLRSSLSIFL